jgi:predicted AlkP superfamily phosphohydrolase/phosphomutase
MLPFKLKKKRPRRRVALIGLDGVSYDQIIDLSNNGHIPNIAKLMEEGSLSKMKTSSPPISPVSWTSCITGVNPASHGMFGYMDRRRESYGIYFPNALQIVSPQIWDYVTFANKSTVAVNVPQTYPAKEINGVMISGFVSLDFKKAVFPNQLCPALEQIDYRIDVDFNEDPMDRNIIYEELLYMLKKRRETFNYLMDRVDWNLFVGVISGTGRINRYLWNDYADLSSEWNADFIYYFKKVDDLVGDLSDKTADDTEFILISDHATAASKGAFYLNTWFRNEGLLKMKSDGKVTFDDIDPTGTKVFALDSGRIYINLKGVMPDGCVEPGDEYNNLRESLIEGLLTLKDESTRMPIIKAISRKEDLYQGSLLKRAPDLVLEAVPGYELSSDIDQDCLLGKNKYEGVPTSQDAFFCIRGFDSSKSNPRLIDISPTILDLLNISVDDKIEGSSIL